MNIFDDIWLWLLDVASWFYQIYKEVSTWVWPFNWLAQPFYQIWYYLREVAFAFHYVAFLWDNVVEAVGKILSEADILSFLKYWLDRVSWAWSWVYNAWDNVWDIIEDWWNTTWSDVKSWVYARIDDVEELIDDAETWLADLQSAWDEWKVKIPSFNELWAWFTNWWSNVLAQIIAWGALPAKEIDKLIKSWFDDYTPFWEGWQEWKDQVIEFFTDPLKWLYNRVEDFMDRYW